MGAERHPSAESARGGFWEKEGLQEGAVKLKLIGMLPYFGGPEK